MTSRPNDWTDALALVPAAVFEIADDLLDSVVTRMAAVPITLPVRRYVHGGAVAFDCEQLVVSVAGLDHSMPGEAAAVAVCAPPRHIALDVWLIRCVPCAGGDDRTPPSPAALTDAAETTLTDLYALAYQLWVGRGDWAPTCASKLFGPVEVVGPEGCFGGVHASVFVQLI